MKLTALIALPLAIFRPTPSIPQSPLFLFALVMIGIVLVQAVILGRPLRAFHYTFLVVGFAASLAITEVAFMPATPGKRGSLQLLGTLIRWYESSVGDFSSNHRIFQYLDTIDRRVTETLGLLIAWAAGLWVARQVKRQGPRPGTRNRHVIPFIQGALIGLGVLTASSFAIDTWGTKPKTPTSISKNLRWSGLAHAPILGSHTRILGCAILPLLSGFTVMYLNQRRNPSGAAVGQEEPEPSLISAS
ncbi:hypothetical protein [Singulisphaera acidiphila]|uniref:Uncharacterized protein n=1 Tax=Singulisphaera acidiphila (strain ATCC BAA-1392 / DSM 18658 / VKM B-2454 / MOB10) TaxID=886293 RepID=L0DIU7_SINAD|nr:hypothetical protein [Singulisphaera acidiphila]AGA28581.1 hypothetical protein Sinac_4390 [Singulisphaera acidiphila DSM 18658]